jgi:Flp pilus assembly protein TadG
MAVTQKTRKRHKMRGQRGQTMVEFAIVLPIFLLLLLGIAQGGIAFNNYIQLTDATRAGARYGAPLACSGSCDRSSLVTSKVQASAANLDTSQVGVTVTSTWQPGTDLRVCASYPFSINLIGLVVSNGNLNSCTTERVE